MSEELEMPFVSVTDVQIAFGGIPNMEAAIAACPKEFFSGSMRGYHRLANDVFAHFAGWTRMPDGHITEMRAATDMSKYTDDKWRYIQTWAKSFAPKHEEKEAVMAWCLSLVMKEPPPYTLK